VKPAALSRVFLVSSLWKKGSDWNKAYNSDHMFYELDAYGRTGHENITEEDLKNMGY